jgi:ribonuclease D
MVYYIDTKQRYDEALQKLAPCRELGIDLEFDKNHYRYGFNLCLMQLSDGENCYLIDPLANEVDISRIFPFLEDPEVALITFAFGEDLRLLHSLGCKPTNIWDLSIMASLLDYPPMSLTKLIMAVLKVEVGKSAQLSNWFERPLTPVQKNYAADDVIYLHEMKRKMLGKAERKHEALPSWIEQENKTWDVLDFTETDTTEFLKIKDKKDLSQAEWHIFTRLMEFREELARWHDRPAYKILDKNYLLQVARDPDRIEDWMHVKNINRSVRKPAIADRADAVLDTALDEIVEQELSDELPAIPRPGVERMAYIRAEKKALKWLKDDFFHPVKQEIARHHGQNTANYILPNRIIPLYLHGEQRELQPFKRELVSKASEAIGLDEAITMRMAREMIEKEATEALENSDQYNAEQDKSDA